MSDLKNLNIEEFVNKLASNGHFLKPVENGIYIRSVVNNSDFKDEIKAREREILEYFKEEYPNNLIEEIHDSLQIVKRMPASISSLVLESINEKLKNTLDVATACDSPIEFQMYFYLLQGLKDFNHKHGTFLWLSNQHPVVANEKEYRADLFISEATGNGDINLIIECDGHDFHEKTKQQAQRDKERDRNLQLAGYRVIHFTGSEIFKDPRKCSKQVTEFLEALI